MVACFVLPSIFWGCADKKELAPLSSAIHTRVRHVPPRTSLRRWFLSAAWLLTHRVEHRDTRRATYTRVQGSRRWLEEELGCWRQKESIFRETKEPDDEGYLRVLGACRRRLGERIRRRSCVHGEVRQLQLHLISSFPMDIFLLFCPFLRVLPRRVALPSA